MASFSRGCPACFPKKRFIAPLGQVGGEIRLLVQVYQESRGQEGVVLDVGVIVVERGVDLRTRKRLAADLATFHAQDSSDLTGLQSKRGLLALAVSHADSYLMTLLGLNHLDVRTSPSAGHSRALELTPIIRNEQQRLTLFEAELSQRCSIAESGWGVADPR
jgi:hypothetical protein